MASQNPNPFTTEDPRVTEFLNWLTVRTGPVAFEQLPDEAFEPRAEGKPIYPEIFRHAFDWLGRGDPVVLIPAVIDLSCAALNLIYQQPHHRWPASTTRA